MWFIFALITTLCWGAADVFYKSGADENDSCSHLKTSVVVGLIMGAHAIFTLIAKHVSYNPINMLIYLPVSAMYILSMTVGYFGLRYLELSISSPIQNSSGVVAGIMSFLFLKQAIDGISLTGIIFIVIGVIWLGVIEKQIQSDDSISNDKKYRIGFAAFFMPIIYCIIDALGTFLDGYYLDDFSSTPLADVTKSNFEDVANISYELTFLLAAIILIAYIKFIKKDKVFSGLKTPPRFAAAAFETLGQATYVYALSGGKAAVAAPMIGSYCIFSIIFSAVFLKERLKLNQYITISLVCIGIILLGIAEGLAG